MRGGGETEKKTQHKLAGYYHVYMTGRMFWMRVCPNEWSQSNALHLIAVAARGIACVMRADVQKSAFERKRVTANLHRNRSSLTTPWYFAYSHMISGHKEGFG